MFVVVDPNLSSWRHLDLRNALCLNSIFLQNTLKSC